MFSRREGCAHGGTKKLKPFMMRHTLPVNTLLGYTEVIWNSDFSAAIRVQLAKLSFYLVEWKSRVCVYAYLIMLRCFHYLKTCNFLLKAKVLRSRLSFALMSCNVWFTGRKKNAVYGPEFWYIFADKFLWKRWKLIIYYGFVEIFLLIELVFNWVLCTF
jgi:hypothetical protein